MPKLSKKKNPIIHMRVRNIFRQANRYIYENPLFSMCIFIVNLVYMLLFKAMPGGISNPYSILWIITYYMFWCSFYRYYYHLKPYIFSKAIFGSLTPSTKALVLLFIVSMSIVLLPMIPLFLGFNDIYLNFYERYMQSVEKMSDAGEVGASFLDIFIVYSVLALLAPNLICKPYLAWISSLRGQNASFRKAGNKTKGNYFGFVIISALLLYPEAVATKLDKIFGLDDWLSYTASTIIFVYTNIVFAKMYNLFYLKH